MGWKAAVKVKGDSSFAENALIFETREEVEEYAKKLDSRWLVSKEIEFREVTETANYKWVNNHAEKI